MKHTVKLGGDVDVKLTIHHFLNAHDLIFSTTTTTTTSNNTTNRSNDIIWTQSSVMDSILRQRLVIESNQCINTTS